MYRQICSIQDEVNEFAIFLYHLHEDYNINVDIWMIDGTFRSAAKRA